MVICYASFRSVCPDNIFTVAATSGGNITTSGTLYFWAQFKNRVGWNKPAASKSLTYQVGDRITVTIADNILSGEEVFAVSISASEINDPATSRQLAVLNIRQSDQVTFLSLPATIILTRDEHLKLATTVTNQSNLPTGLDLKTGMVREVTSEGKIYEYDGTTWIPRSTISNYVDDPSSGVGSDRTIELIDSTDILISPTKELNLDSTPIRLWWLNGYDEDGGAQLNTGSKAQLTFWINGQPDTENLFADRVKIKLVGYIRRSTGVLDTNIEGSNYQYPWNPNNPLILKQPLPRGYAALVELVLSFDNDELGLESESQITASLKPLGEVGSLTELWKLMGDGVFVEGNKLLILPNRRLSGSGLVKGYAVSSTSEQYLINPLPDTEQVAAINGARNGEIVLRQASQLTPSEAVRAIVSTEPGTQTASALTLNTTVAANGSLGISIQHPTAIRSDYPDAQIRGKTAPLNTGFYLYIQTGTTIYRSNSTYFPTPGTQTITINSLNNFTPIASLPNNPDPAFGLFGYGAVNLVAGSGGSLAAGNYRVALAYHYPSPNYAITKISHDPQLGCIRSLDYGDMRMSVYDPNGDGVVKDSDRLNNQLPAYYLNRANHTGNQSASSINDFNSAADARIAAAAGATIASLVSGKIPISQLPANTINNSFVVNSQAAMLALAAVVGDIAFRTDEGNRSYICAATPPTTLSNWLGQNVTTGAADMQRAIYDTTGNNIVDNSERLNNQLPAYYLDRANHTGSQLANTISDLDEAIDDRVAALLVAGSNVTVDYNDNTNKITLSSSGTGGGSGSTPEQIRDALALLTGTNRLSANAIKDLPSIGSSGAAVYTLTDAASVVVDGSLGNVFNLTLAGNRAIANPTNLTDGSRILFRMNQDATGGRSVFWGSNYIFPSSAPVLTATANALDLLEFAVVGDKLLFVDADLGFSGVSLAGGSTFNGSTLYDGLVAWWGLEEANGDRLNLAAPGLYRMTPANNPSVVAGRINNQINLTNTSLQRLSTPNTLFNPSTDNFSVGGCIKIKDISTSRYDTLVGVDNASTSSWLIYRNTTNNKFRLALTFTDSTNLILEAPTAVVANTDYFLSATINNTSKTASFSVNETRVATGSFTGKTIANLSSIPISIGALNISSNNVSYHANAYIDEIFIYNRELAQQEITWIYNGGNIRRPWLPGELGTGLQFYLDAAFPTLNDLSSFARAKSNATIPATTTINSKPALNIANASALVYPGTQNLSTVRGAAGVLQVRGVAASDTRFICQGNGSPNLNLLWDINFTATTHYDRRLFTQESGGKNCIGSNAYPTTTPFIDIFTTTAEQVNGVASSVTTSAAARTINNDDIYVGAINAATLSNHTGFIYGAMLLFDTAASQYANIDRLEGWLAHKWGLTANLPANHPYKNLIPQV